MARRRGSQKGGCSRQRIVIRRGKRVIADFMGRHGSGCAPRKFQKGVTPRALRPFAAAAKKCAASGERPGTKSMGKCIVDWGE